MEARYCCFLHPKADYTEKTLDDLCPDCGKPYGFPLTDYPAAIGSFEILEPLSRGFYSAAYITEDPRLGVKRVLKVSPQEIYQFFAKDFNDELRTHARVAQRTQHLVKPIDGFNKDLVFGSVIIPCHIAVLEYVDGEPLEVILSGKRVDARTIAQIGIDLFCILSELQGSAEFHNDLHEGNLIVEKLRGGARRADALDDLIRVVAIDFSSITDMSKSNEETRLGDIHWVSRHLRRMAEQLLTDPDGAGEVDYRLASLLEERAQQMAPPATAQRAVSPEQCIDEIRAAFQQVTSPWSAPLQLRHFADTYNAQTLAPWYVPLLLVDPQDSWLTRVSSPGPQIITGMRGCGKTMLLRALELHARAALREGEKASDALARLAKDGYVGVYVSSTRLLDRLGQPNAELHKPFERLFVAYALAAVRAVRHVAEVSSTSVVSGWYRELRSAISEHLEGNTDWNSIGSEYELESRLREVQVLLSSGGSQHRLRSHVSAAFPDLAERLTHCCSIWSSKIVLFLLDDVSTRYLDQSKIEEIVSALLFQDTRCAFKLTSEAQTLELVLRSPGQIEKARVGRDYEVFDLGSEVYERIKSHRGPGGKSFVEDILTRRAKYYGNHPSESPSRLLGDISLEEIARIIASTPRTAREKKAAYHGIRALARVCVGDIGDIISLYDLILRRGRGRGVPIPPVVQSEAYQDFCSRRLYDLNRRKGELKDFALGFAEASHELLVRSYKDVMSGSDKRKRLRQYISIYVRITTGDADMQYAKLRDLIDAGVFVFAGGSEAPRTKTHDSNPIQQFKLTYRKVYGLSNFIGLAESDRFELSGRELADWLLHPDRGMEILLRNLGGAEREDEDEDEGITETDDRQRPDDDERPFQGRLFIPSASKASSASETAPDAAADAPLGNERALIALREVGTGDLESLEIDVLVAGLGFESRAFQSLSRLLSRIRPKHAVLVRYPEVGKSVEIRQLAAQRVGSVVEIDYQDVLQGKFDLPPGRVLVDVTGLMKPVLFHAVRLGLRQFSRVWIAHTAARVYYPLEKEVAAVIGADEAGDHYKLLEGLTEILTGERSPYAVHRLLAADADESRRRILVAFASPKHERLLTLLDQRDYDRLELVAPTGISSRNRLAQIVAEVAKRNFPSCRISTYDTNDVEGLVGFLARSYHQWYVQRGFNFEIGLTGSKLQAVAAGALAAMVKISEALYVGPAAWDPKRFTKGVGKSTFFEISGAD